MRTKHFQECLREHRAAEAAAEAEGETSGPEGREKTTKEEWMTGRRE